MGELIMKNLPLKTLALVGMALVVLASGAYAQGLLSEPEVVIYGSGSRPGNITFGGWGGGICRESNQNALSGPRSIEITPRGFYQGGRLDFTEPVDLTTYFRGSDYYLQMVTRFRGVRAVNDPWAIDLAPPGSTDIYAGSSTSGKPIRRVQVILFLESGKGMETQVDVSSYRLQEDGWMVISLPFAALKGDLNISEYKMRRLALTGDGTEAFHIGEIRVMKDSTPLEAYAGEEKETGRNYSIVFHGTAKTGASAVKYSWDFDKNDGIQEQAVGELVSYRYNQAGEFTATLTVTDIFGIKKPAISTVRVKIND